MNIRFYFKPVFSLFVLLFIFTNCSIYQLKEKKVENDNTSFMLNSLKLPFIVVHIGNASWQLNNPVIHSETIQGELIPVHEKALTYYDLAKKKRNFHVPIKDKNYAKQLHLYIDDVKFNGTYAEIDFNRLKKMELVRKSQGIQVLTYGTLAAGASFGAFIIYFINAWS